MRRAQGANGPAKLGAPPSGSPQRVICAAFTLRLAGLFGICLVVFSSVLEPCDLVAERILESRQGCGTRARTARSVIYFTFASSLIGAEPLGGNANARVAAYARAWSARNRQPRQGQRGPITRAFLDVLQALLWDFQRHEIGRSVLGRAVNRRAEQGMPIVVIVRQV